MPFCRSLFEHTPIQSMNSVYPTISCVAWATYMTGRNPGQHNIFGFIDRTLSPFSMTIPNGSNLASPPLWQTLGTADIPVLVMNVPVTYPPDSVNGTMVSGFLGVRLEKSVFPPDLIEPLESFGYLIDADTSQAVADPDAFLNHLEFVLDRRCDAFIHLAKTRPWEFAHLHIMETDRLFHFLWDRVDKSMGPDRDVLQFFAHLDHWIQRIFETVIRDEDEVILLSDHGFCKAETELQLNTVLADHGFLKWSSGDKPGLHRIHPESQAYSLIPGRIFLNQKGRELQGSVNENDRELILDELISLLSEFSLNGSETPCFEQIFRREEIYNGQFLENSADLIAIPREGIELKGKLAPAPVFSKSVLKGMHTYDNAFVWSRQGTTIGTASQRIPGIIDLYPTILSYFEKQDEGAEGRIIFNYN